jgi:mannose-6-phosphate isomerase-like protein (cupin superfamily)
MTKPVSKTNPLNHYKWGNNCDGWNLVNKAEVVIKQELMPPKTTEKLHFHTHSEQFFYILKGSATFLLENETLLIQADCGLVINAGKKHKIMNNESQDLEFILISYPSTVNDRTDCE